MSENVLYTTQWNVLNRQPIAGHEWLAPADAHDAYESMQDLEIVDAAVLDADGLPLPRWVIGAGSSARFRVQFFDANTTRWRMVDYDWLPAATGKRLWRWVTYDYAYDDMASQKGVSESTRTWKSAVKPDGAGQMLVVDKTSGKREKVSFTERASDEYWLDRPTFGDWRRLIEPGPSAAEVAGVDAPVLS